MKITDKKIIILIIIILVVVGLGYSLSRFNLDSGRKIGDESTDAAGGTPAAEEADENFKTFVFDSFHGSADISDKFEFRYPASWFNEGQYFSPQKIQYYDMYSVKAPIYFDLILADIFDQTEFKYQIDTDKRIAKDATGTLDGRTFKKYDLIDYGSYGGESAGRVKIFVGPRSRIDGDDYILVFRWEEKPLAESMAGNDVGVFDEMMMSLKFRK